MREAASKRIVVWDRATRIFHWLLVIAVAINLFFISPRGEPDSTIHYTIGYAVLGLLMFRIAWGFVGSPHSRFADFVHGWSSVRQHIDRLRRRVPVRSVGHNPLGGWMIMALIATLLVMAATGPFASDRRVSGPLAHLIARSWSLLLGDVHATVSNLLIGLVVLHLLGVAFAWVVERENLVLSMLTGVKTVPEALARAERPLASPALAVLLGAVAVALAGALIWLTV